MAKQKLAITVRGKRGEWEFHFRGDPVHLEEWRADGLEVHQVANTVPVWVKELGLTRVWCRLQDVGALRWPFNRWN